MEETLEHKAIRFDEAIRNILIEEMKVPNYPYRSTRLQQMLATKSGKEVALYLLQSVPPPNTFDYLLGNNLHHLLVESYVVKDEFVALFADRPDLIEVAWFRLEHGDMKGSRFPICRRKEQ